MERRENYIDMLESKIISTKLPDLVQLVKKCLSNVPSERPTTDNLLSTLQMMKAEMEGEYGGPIRLDMVRVRLAKEVKAKNRRIEELTRQKVMYFYQYKNTECYLNLLFDNRKDMKIGWRE